MTRLDSPQAAADHLFDLGFPTAVWLAAAELQPGGQPEQVRSVQWRGEDKVQVSLRLAANASGEVELSDLKVAMLRVPLEHAVVDGIDTRQLERSLKFYAEEPELFDMPDNEMAMIEGVVDEVRELSLLLSKLRVSEDPRGAEIAGLLELKYWSWEEPFSGYLHLKDTEKVFLAERVFHELPELSKVYADLQGQLDEQLKNYFKQTVMNINKNNLENLQQEVRGLKFPEDYVKRMEEQMAKGDPFFQLKGNVPVEKGQMDVALNFRKSSQSEFYYFNSYQMAYSDKAPKLEEGHQFLVISPGAPGKENLMRKFDSALDAILYFKEQKGNSELAIGKPNAQDLDLRQKVAEMTDGKVDYVAKEHRQFYYAPAMTQTQYLDQGKGYNVNQLSNMLQGHAVYRDDLVNRKTGELYAAWAQFQFNQEKDRYGNYQVKQMSDPAYGFDLNRELQGYKIKELEQPKKLEAIVEGLKDGFRMPVTLTKPDGAEVRLNVEAMPRYGNLNFYQANGKPEHREQFQKSIGQEAAQDKAKARGKEVAAGQEVGL